MEGVFTELLGVKIPDRFSWIWLELEGVGGSIRSDDGDRVCGALVGDFFRLAARAGADAECGTAGYETSHDKGAI